MLFIFYIISRKCEYDVYGFIGLTRNKSFIIMFMNIILETKFPSGESITFNVANDKMFCFFIQCCSYLGFWVCWERAWESKVQKNSFEVVNKMNFWWNECYIAIIPNAVILKSSNSIHFRPLSGAHHITATNTLAYNNKEDLIVWKTSFIF